MRTTESGITRRGNCIFRTTPSWAATEVTARWVASAKKVNSMMLSSSTIG